MPGYPRGRQGGRGYYRRGFKKKSYVNKRAVEKVVKDMLRPEEKIRDWAQQDVGIPQSWNQLTTVNPGDIQQGLENNERIGRKILVTKLYFKWVMHNDASFTDAGPEVVRLSVILDRVCDGAQASNSDIFASATGAPAVLSFNNPDTTKRFKTLYDSGTVMIPKNGGAGNGTTNVFAPSIVHGEVYLKNLNIEVTYDTTLGTVADLTTTNILLWSASNSSSLARISYSMRLRYTDV